MGVELDHLLWAAPDLHAGSALMAALTGVTPARGGSHPGFGTRNSLVGLGHGCYLEVIAPDPEQPLDYPRAKKIAALPRPSLLTFAVRTTDLDAYRMAAEAVDVPVSEPVAMGRTRPDGVRLAWSCLYVDHPTYGDLLPFAIDWKDSPHPSGSVPPGLALKSFAALHPDPEPLRRLYARLGVPVAVRRADRPGLVAELSTPQGDVTLLAA